MIEGDTYWSHCLVYFYVIITSLLCIITSLLRPHGPGRDPPCARGLAEAGFALRRWRRHGQLHALVAGEITQLGAESVHVVAEVAELCLYGAR